MLKKNIRADKKTVEKIFSAGKFVGSGPLSLKFFIDRKEKSPRISFIVPKSVSKSAVERNSLRRKGYIAVKEYINKLPAGFKGAFVFKKKSLDIKKEIENILAKIH